VLIVASKRDKANQSELSKGLRSIREKFGLDENPLSVSSFKKFGLDSLWQNILEALELPGQENDKKGI
jgi:GTP-binding protein